MTAPPDHPDSPDSPDLSIPAGARTVRMPQGYAFHLVGEERIGVRDLFYQFLRMSWTASLALIAAGFFAVNLVFALIYYFGGGVVGVRDGSFFDALVFSVQTLGTIGYGAMYPKSDGANVVMMIESVAGLIVTALATGLVFTKFARATAKVAFSSHIVITNHDGQPTLMFRLGNRRGNTIVEAQLRVIASMVQTTAEGQTFYKLHDLKLVRDRMTGMRRGWLAMHTIDETSPFFGLDAAALAKSELELEAALIGHDDVTMQTVHAMCIYTDKQLRFGQRFVDTMRSLPSGDVIVDLRNFDRLEPDDGPRERAGLGAG